MWWLGRSNAAATILIIPDRGIYWSGLLPNFTALLLNYYDAFFNAFTAIAV